ncbi:ASCH domain-containing protein, partial [Methylomagnum sp.]
PRLVEATKTGQKTQQRRDGLYAYPGETFELDGVAFTVTEVERRRLGDMTEADAQAEGYPNLAVYKDLILKMHAGMTWDEEHLVWVHHFQRVDS